MCNEKNNKILTIENTPNPEVIKFNSNILISPDHPISFHKDDSKNLYECSLANNVLNLWNLNGLFFGYDFISITKKKEEKWDDLKNDIKKYLENYLSHEKLVFVKKIKVETEEKINLSSEKTQHIIKEIKDLLEVRVRPAVARDGGDIEFDKFVDGVVYVHLKGACSGCPKASATLKMGIENLLRYFIPEVKKVVASN